MKYFRTYTNNKNAGGFVLPTIILLTLIMSFVAYAALLQSNNNLNLSYKQAYIQIARIASKSAIDYAQEQFDNSACGEYTGTPETTIMNNNRYRVTMKSEVVSTSTDGYEKTIKGIGSVYLPRTSANAKYVFDIRSEIVRTYALCKTPDNFNPLLWLDASDTTTLKKGIDNTTTVSASTSFGSASASTRDTVEERADNGSQTTASWQSNDLEMHNCDNTEFSSSICSNSSQRYTYSGMVFQGLNIPKNATITAANLSISGGTPAGQGGSTTHRIYGLYQTASNPHLNLFSQTGTNQIRTPITTSNLHTSAYTSVTTNNFPPGNTSSFNVTNVVQEVVDNPNWDPAASGNGGRIGFGIQRQSGNGTRRALKNGIQLTVSYTATTLAQATNGESLSEWYDKSTNQYHAVSTHGTAPTRVDNQINGKTVVRFVGGNMLSTLSTALSNERNITVLGVIKPNFTSSNSDGRLVSGMHSSGSNDTGGSNSIIPLLRYASNSGFSSLYANNISSNRTDASCSPNCNNQATIVASSFSTINNSSVLSSLRINGAASASKTITPSTSTPPYTFSIDQLYIGGRRNGTMPGSGTNYLYGDYGEIIVYDKTLTCREIEALEEYLRDKWNVYSSTPQTTCSADIIPTL